MLLLRHLISHLVKDAFELLLLVQKVQFFHAIFQLSWTYDFFLGKVSLLLDFELQISEGVDVVVHERWLNMEACRATSLLVESHTLSLPTWFIALLLVTFSLLLAALLYLDVEKPFMAETV